VDSEINSSSSDWAKDDLLDQREHRACERSHWARERLNGQLVAGLSGIAALAAILAAIIAYYAFLETRRQAEAAWAQVKIYQDIERRQLRAYLTFQDGAIRCTQSSDCGLQLTIKNSGQTPAYNVTCYFASQSRASLPEPLTIEAYANFEFQETGAASIDLGNGDTQGLPACAVGTFVKTLSNPAGLQTYAWGIVKYRDIFQHCHRSAFLAKSVDVRGGGKTDAGKLQFLWQSADGDGGEPCVGNPPRVRFRN
jgi:hypothetical protein